MDAQIMVLCVLGIFVLYIHSSCTTPLHTKGYMQFLDNDQRTRNKRNSEPENSTSSTGGSHVKAPEWMEYYGSDSYMQRKIYKDNPRKEPTVCFNNKTQDDGIVYKHFICPMENDTVATVFCCGESPAQTCCTEAQYEADKEDDDTKSNAEIDIVTGISIAAGFVVSFTLCMFLYCCCCQRRHEIHDGVKLMWVRRSFGKELNRLEQPAYQDHMTVVNSITGLRETSRRGSRQCSRQGSRQGSRAPSRQGSIRSTRSRQGSFKGGSRNPTPSISRRPSNGPVEHSVEKHHTGQGDRRHLGLEVPTNVVITVTTPSDEQGPTAPLLKTAHNTDRCNTVHVHFDDVVMTSSPS